MENTFWVSREKKKKSAYHPEPVQYLHLVRPKNLWGYRWPKCCMCWYLSVHITVRWKDFDDARIRKWVKKRWICRDHLNVPSIWWIRRDHCAKLTTHIKLPTRYQGRKSSVHKAKLYKTAYKNSFWWLWSDQSTPRAASCSFFEHPVWAVWNHHDWYNTNVEDIKKKNKTCLVKKYCMYLFRWPMMIVQTIFSIRIQGNYAFYSV